MDARGTADATPKGGRPWRDPRDVLHGPPVAVGIARGVGYEMRGAPESQPVMFSQSLDVSKIVPSLKNGSVVSIQYDWPSLE